MSTIPHVLIEINGRFREGVSGKGQPYCMYEGYVHIPGIPYPQKADFYANARTEVPQVGVYEVDLILDVKDGRFVMNADPRQGRRSSLPPLSAAKEAKPVA